MQRSGDHGMCSAPCGHTFGYCCIVQHLAFREAARAPACCAVPSCQGPRLRSRDQLLRLYLGSQQEWEDEERGTVRAKELMRALEVEGSLVEAARRRAEAAEADVAAYLAALAALQPVDDDGAHPDGGADVGSDAGPGAFTDAGGAPAPALPLEIY